MLKRRLSSRRGLFPLFFVGYYLALVYNYNLSQVAEPRIKYASITVGASNFPSVSYLYLLRANSYGRLVKYNHRRISYQSLSNAHTLPVPLKGFYKAPLCLRFNNFAYLLKMLWKACNPSLINEIQVFVTVISRYRGCSGRYPTSFFVRGCSSISISSIATPDLRI